MTAAAPPTEATPARQQAAWEETFRYAGKHSRFYREHFARAGISPADKIPLADIARIPPVDKSVVCQQPDEFLCVPREKIVDIVTTSGTTGQPLLWQLTDSDLERLGYNEQLSFATAGFTAADTVLLAVAMDRCFIAGMAYFLGLRKLACGIVRAGPAAPALHLDMIRRVRPTAVVSVPSFLHHVAEKARETGFDLAAAGIRKAVCIGEPVRENDFSLNRAGQLIETHWGAKVFSTYGVTELAASLCECPAGQGGHLHPGLLYLEALDEAGQPVPDGQAGELTATTLGVEAMPLIRYRSGDFAAIHRAPCACGRTTLRIGPIVGRKNQKLKLKGTTVFPSALKTILDTTPEVSTYAIIARRENDLADTIEIKISCSGDAAKISAALRERFRGEIKVAPHITPATAAEIEELQLPPGARKRRYFADLRH
ncbi:MAG TPA: AMP-binding protein [Verrucomicrobiae bacterium]|nr:AMP-binding protein [Verrucomicrobiae bacterium]